jgi:hypothetical protein
MQFDWIQLHNKNQNQMLYFLLSLSVVLYTQDLIYHYNMISLVRIYHLYSI